MSYQVIYEIAGRSGVITCAEPATANANRAIAAMEEYRAAGRPSWIRCGNGQVITAGW